MAFALALVGGGIRGTAYAGVLAALIEASRVPTTGKTIVYTNTLAGTRGLFPMWNGAPTAPSARPCAPARRCPPFSIRYGGMAFARWMVA